MEPSFHDLWEQAKKEAAREVPPPPWSSTQGTFYAAVAGGLADPGGGSVSS